MSGAPEPAATASSDPPSTQGRGPQHRTLRWLITSITDPALWRDNGDGTHTLRVAKQVLAGHAGITPASLTSRLATLRHAGYLTTEHPLTIHTAGLTTRPNVVSLHPHRPASRLADQLEHAGYHTDPATGTYRHTDGHHATLTELAAATGRSTGTIQHHLTTTRTTPRAGASACADTINRLTALLTTIAHHHPDHLDNITRYATRALDLLTAEDAAETNFEPHRGKRDPDLAFYAATAENTAEQGSDLEFELNLNSAQNTTNPRTAGTNPPNPRPASTDDAIPAAARTNLGDPIGTDRARFDELVARPLAAAHARHLPQRNPLQLGLPALHAAAAWPADLLTYACARLVDDLTDHPDHVDNWGGLITAVLRDGRTRYLPLTPPPTAEQQRRADLEHQAARWHANLTALHPDDAHALTDTLRHTNPDLHAHLTRLTEPAGEQAPHDNTDRPESEDRWRSHLNSVRSHLERRTGT